MRESGSKIFDDLAKLATDAAGAAQGLRRDAESAMRSGLERLLRDMNLVTREEFEAVRDMAAKARAENERLSLRLAELEARLPAAAGAAPASPRTGAKAKKNPPLS